MKGRIAGTQSLDIQNRFLLCTNPPSQATHAALISPSSLSPYIQSPSSVYPFLLFVVKHTHPLSISGIVGLSLPLLP